MYKLGTAINCIKHNCKKFLKGVFGMFIFCSVSSSQFRKCIRVIRIDQVPFCFFPNERVDGCLPFLCLGRFRLVLVLQKLGWFLPPFFLILLVHTASHVWESFVFVQLLVLVLDLFGQSYFSRFSFGNDFYRVFCL